MSVSQSVNVHLRDSTSALYIPKDISTQLTESTGSAPRHTRTVQLGVCGLRRAAGEDDLFYKSSRSTKVSLWYLSFRLASEVLLYMCIILPSFYFMASAFCMYCNFKIKLAYFCLSVLMLPAGVFVVTADSQDKLPWCFRVSLWTAFIGKHVKR